MTVDEWMKRDSCGPLPEPDVSWVDGKDEWGYDAYSHSYSDAAMRAYAAQQVAAERERWRDVVAYAEAALADIGDAEREPGDDLAWCESRAAAALPRVRAALALFAIMEER